MKINKLELRNFKRLDDLTIDMTGLAETPKLVLLIGAKTQWFKHKMEQVLTK